jgi:hypothetical protein
MKSGLRSSIEESESFSQAGKNTFIFSDKSISLNKKAIFYEKSARLS